MSVISETPFIEDPDNCKEVKFATTPVMSTYLLAFIVGEFDFVEDKTSDGIPVRVYTPLGKRDKGLFALEVAVKALSFYKQYFNIAYPLPKMDLIAIADLSSVAMENCGLVTRKKTELLIHQQNSCVVRKQWIALTVAHALAHHWFDSLVTMEWWTHLWLNEGFARFMMYLCVDHLFSEYCVWTQLVTDISSEALFDSLHNSHAIEVPVGHPSEIDKTDDDISHSKGFCIIRMLHNFVGDESFRKGMNIYLTRHRYKNTVTEDLWTALEEASGKPVGDVMSSWTKQKGFPVISVTARQEGNSRIITLIQEKFCFDGKLPESEANTLWMIPISVNTSSSPEKAAIQALMDSKSLELTVENINTDEWLKLNCSSIGVYRVQYSSVMLSLILPAIANKTFSPLDRLGVLNDMFAMVKSGRSSTVDVLKLLDAFADEDNHAVWFSIFPCLYRLNILLSHTQFQPLFHKYGRQLLYKTYSRLGWNEIKEESHFYVVLRAFIIDFLAAFDDEDVICQLRNLFESHCNKTCDIPICLMDAAYRAVALNCDDKTFDSLFALYRETDSHEDIDIEDIEERCHLRECLSRALGSVNDSNRIEKVLQFSISSEVRSEDTVLIIETIAINKFGRDIAWKFFVDNKDELRRRYEDKVILSELVEAVTENFASEEKAQEIELFFAENPFAGTERAVKQSLETIRLNAEWLSRDSSAVDYYLLSRN